MSELGAGLPAQILAAAQLKVDGFQRVKAEISSHLAEIDEKVETVRRFIHENTCTESCLLTSDETKYFDCLEIRKDQLEELLE